MPCDLTHRGICEYSQLLTVANFMTSRHFILSVEGKCCLCQCKPRQTRFTVYCLKICKFTCGRAVIIHISYNFSDRNEWRNWVKVATLLGTPNVVREWIAVHIMHINTVHIIIIYEIWKISRNPENDAGGDDKVWINFASPKTVRKH